MFPDLVKQEAKLEKLKFIACKNDKFEEKTPASEYSVMFNPNNIAIKLQVERGTEQPPGSTGAPQPFVRTKPQDYSFEFIIDATGATGTSRAVPEDVRSFLEVVYDYESADHQPNYVKIVYGSVLLKCVLKSVDITYNLFQPNGRPLRAKVNASFSSVENPELNAKIKNENSPDLTHKRRLKRSDKLVSMANKIYNNNNLYPEVARANELDTFRSIPEGTEIFFPPIDKKITASSTNS